MPKLLKDLRIDDVSSVDRGAGRGVRVLLTKRDLDFEVDVEKIWASNDELPSGVKNNLPGEAQSVFRRVANDRMKAGQSEESAIKQAWTAVKNGWSKQGDKWVRKNWDEDNYPNSITKREFSTAERESAAESGAAMPHGGYPIKNKQDLKNAIQAIGRAKDRAATIAHIKTRARALGATDLIPESWSKSESDPVAEMIAEFEALNKEVDLTVQDDATVCEDVNALIGELNKALGALQTSLSSIMEDDEVDKREALDQSIDQFKAHIASIALQKGADDLDIELDKSEFGEFELVEKAESAMAIKLPEKLQAIVDEAVSKAVADQKADQENKIKELTDVLAKKDEEIAKLGMTKEQQSFYDGMKDDDQKKNFRGLSSGDRDSYMAQTRKRYGEDPIYKQQAEEIEKLRKRLEAVEYEREMELAKIEARDLGMRGEKDPEIVLKMKRSCDEGTYEAWKSHIKSLQKQRDAFAKESKAFVELGTLQGNSTGSAIEELNAKAAELRKSKPEITVEKAFDAVYADPANRDLVMREKDERMAKIHRVAV